MQLFGTKGQRDKLKILPKDKTGQDSQNPGLDAGKNGDRAEKYILKRENDVLKQKTMF